MDPALVVRALRKSNTITLRERNAVRRFFAGHAGFYLGESLT